MAVKQTPKRVNTKINSPGKSTKQNTAKIKSLKKLFVDAVNPATLTKIARVECTDLSQMRDIFAKAREAQKIWQSYPGSRRKKHILRMRDYIVTNAETLAGIIHENSGKSKVDALAVDVIPSALATDWYAKNVSRVLRPKNLSISSFIFINKRNVLIRIPLGIVGIISPYNYPLGIPFHEIIMALVTGNAVMLKVSNTTIMVGKAIEEIIASGNLPAGLFHHIIGRGGVITDEFIKNKIDKIFFTGSVQTGKEIYKKAGQHLIPVSLELGGKDPMIVLPDANLERASNGACWAGYQSTGQSCGGVERVYVHEDIYDKFIDLMTKKTNSLRHGISADFNTDIGCLATAGQLNIVKTQVDEALKKGAKIIATSRHIDKNKGYYYPATLMINVDHSMRIMTEETFGPVIPVMKFKTIEEAIQLANDSAMALTSSIWTKNVELGKKIALKLESGTTTINDHLYTHGQAETPWGGWKNSGIGRTHSLIGLEEMTQPKVINWDILPVKRNFWWYPFNKKTYEGLLSVLRISFPRGPGQFIKNAIKFFPLLIGKMFTSWKSDPVNKN